MGKILNTTYHDSVQNITEFYNDLVNNPFYVLNDKKPTIVTYYNINKDYSSLDPGSKLYMDNNGSESPIKYNRIYDFLLYGFNRVELQTDNDEFGLEAEKIEGECYILPNTIVPTEGDYFEVSHVKDSTWLFIVTDVQKDTLDNGSNAYKIHYKLEYNNHDDLLQKIVYNFKLIDVREGTNISKIVRCEDLEIAKLMDEKAVTLKKYFQELFYNDKVQTFIYMGLTEYYIYDSFMIEFLIRNKILNDGEDSYIFVSHQLPLVSTIQLDYNKTFFRKFEEKDLDGLIKSVRETGIQEIVSYGTTFASRFETYFETTYNPIYPGFKFSCLQDDLIYRINDNKLYEEDSESNELWKNIIIKYFHDNDLNENEIKSIDEWDFKGSDAQEVFYLIPLVIFCLERYIEKALK